jgi:hypothetical protein
MVNQNYFDPSLLLYWLTHRGEVSRRTLRSAIDGILSEETEDIIKTSTIRRRLIELGHAVTGDGVDGYDRLRILPPYLTILPDGNLEKAEGLLCGGRTPAFLSKIQSTCENYAIWLMTKPQENAPERITLCGNIEDLRAIATTLSVPLIEQAVERHIIQASILWAQQFELAPIEKEPRSQDCECWNWSTRGWRNGLLEKKEGGIVRLTVGFGNHYYLLFHQGKWRRILSEASAKYFSAGIIKEPIVQYNIERKTLITSLRPPLELSRPLCLCSGSSHRSVNRDFLYENVSEAIASRWTQAFGLTL